MGRRWVFGFEGGGAWIAKTTRWERARMSGRLKRRNVVRGRAVCRASGQFPWSILRSGNIQAKAKLRNASCPTFSTHALFPPSCSLPPSLCPGRVERGPTPHGQSTACSVRRSSAQVVVRRVTHRTGRAGSVGVRIAAGVAAGIWGNRFAPLFSGNQSRAV